ncbi:hypothetical protein K525DRAFT_252970 [Schizophyllum commune Loenen D]|nr:hypothetical protein K525DRAFT_252970 [Schizophyllum commune Loenen D]
MPWPEFAVAVLVLCSSTPYFMHQKYLDETTTPWSADAINESIVVADVIEATLVTDSSREPRALLASTEHDPDVDLIQAFIEAGVIADVNLNDVYICNPWPEREPPTLLALYTRPLLDSSPSSNACGTTTSERPGSEARQEPFKTAEQQIADAGRNPDCRLIHLCPICEE